LFEISSERWTKVPLICNFAYPCLCDLESNNAGGSISSKKASQSSMNIPFANLSEDYVIKFSYPIAKMEQSCSGVLKLCGIVMTSPI